MHRDTVKRSSSSLFERISLTWMLWTPSSNQLNHFLLLNREMFEPMNTCGYILTCFAVFSGPWHLPLLFWRIPAIVINMYSCYIMLSTMTEKSFVIKLYLQMTCLWAGGNLCFRQKQQILQLHARIRENELRAQQVLQSQRGWLDDPHSLNTKVTPCYMYVIGEHPNSQFDQSFTYLYKFWLSNRNQWIKLQANTHLMKTLAGS